MKKFRWLIFLLLIAWLLTPVAAYAQSYLFRLTALNLQVSINADGSASMDYVFDFANAPGAHSIDYVDVGMPNNRFSMSGVKADVDGKPVSVSQGDYEGSGSGFAVVLGGNAIRAGQSGKVHVYIPNAGTWLQPDTEGDDYASFVVSPTWFGKQYVQDTTVTRVTIIFPPGVQPNEPRWHAAPSGFRAEPVTGVGEDGRVFYTWSNAKAYGYEQYKFGVSFPAQYVPASAIQKTSILEALGIDSDMLTSIMCCGSMGVLFTGISMLSAQGAKKRRLKYLPPKIAIEGMGIKRGLTAVEAAILMEQPLDKVLTMILFGLVKKAAVTVTAREPLEITPADPLPESLYDYEREFIAAFTRPKGERRRALQTMTIDLVKAVAAKVKGFSHKETLAYYKDIMERAWKQVESAQTPQVQSEAFDKYMEWTMLDRDYDDRTRRTFTGPVFVPTWWPRYDPVYRQSTMGGGSVISGRSGSGGSSGGGGSVSLPTLPGSSFAASVIGGVQNFSAGVVGDLTSFTGGITDKTNPVPIATSSRGGSGGGRSCACACACAGCACACAGGGR